MMMYRPHYATPLQAGMLPQPGYPIMYHAALGSPGAPSRPSALPLLQGLRSSSGTQPYL